MHHRLTRTRCFLSVLVMALFAALVSSIPVTYAWLKTPDGSTYQFCRDQSDHNTYYAKMWAGYRGAWLGRNIYTSEEHPAILWYPFYIALGHIAAWYRDLATALTGHEPPVTTVFPIVFHAVRILLLISLCFAIYAVASLVFPRRSTRMWALAFALFAGGWLPTPSQQTIVSSFFYPHFVAAHILYLSVCAAFILALQGGSGWFLPIALASAGGFGLAWVHPYDLVALSAIGCVAFIVRWGLRRRFPGLLCAAGIAYGVAAGAPIVCLMSVFARVPVFASINHANVLPWSSWLEPLARLEGLLLCALVSLPILWKRSRRPEALFVVAWVCAGLAVLYVPVPFVRRLAEGLTIGLAFASVFLARECLAPAIARWRSSASHPALRQRLRRAQRWAFGGLFLLLVPKTLFSLHQEATWAARALSYVDGGERQALEWLRDNTDADDVIWAREKTGNRIPYFTGRRVFCGHWAETNRYSEKRALTEMLFSGSLDPGEFQEILRRNRISYVLWIDPVNAPAGGFVDPNALYGVILKAPVYTAGRFRIYRLGTTASSIP